MDSCIAILNAGSSSIKFALYDAAVPDAGPLYKGKVEEIGCSAPRMQIADADGESVVERSWSDGVDHGAATLELLRAARQLIGGVSVAGVGHRVVHGGLAYAAPVLVDDLVIETLERLSPLAPLHQPHNLAPIREIAAAAPHIPQVACFDTAFHRTQPAVAQAYALPRRFSDAGVRRYGFHGLSYEYVGGRLANLAPHLATGRTIIAHLGNGASCCALLAGRSVAATMGFTAVEGLMMGTRCGSLDPGVMVHLIDAYGMDARALEDLIYRRSGLLGVSGISSDMRRLRASDEPAAAEATTLFCYRVVREIGSLAAALGGLDGLVFTGGIGENDADTRAEISRACAWLGLDLDEARNAAGSGRISAAGSRVEAWVVPTDEEAMMARHTREILGLSATA